MRISKNGRILDGLSGRDLLLKTQMTFDRIIARTGTPNSVHQKIAPTINSVHQQIVWSSCYRHRTPPSRPLEYSLSHIMNRRVLCHNMVDIMTTQMRKNLRLSTSMSTGVQKCKTKISVNYVQFQIKNFLKGLNKNFALWIGSWLVKFFTWIPCKWEKTGTMIKEGKGPRIYQWMSSLITNGSGIESIHCVGLTLKRYIMNRNPNTRHFPNGFYTT